MSDAIAQAMPKDGRLAYKWKVLISVVFGVFMSILDSTVVNVAFQTLRQEFGARLNDSQWIISIYVLALGISTPLAGFLADRFGIKRIYLTGLVTFVFGSFLSGIAPNLWFLVAARAVQGFGGGIALPLGSAQLYAAFPLSEQGLALGIFGIAILVAPALGPILGGLLVDHNVWRLIFFINIPIGLIGVSLGSRFLRERLSPRKPTLNLFSLFASVIGFGSVLYAASIAADQGWTSRPALTWFALGATGLAAFAISELRASREPLLDLRLYARRNFLSASLVGYVTVLALFGAEFLMPIYLQALRGLTALQTGFILLPLALTAGVTTPIAGRLYDKIGPRALAVTGFSVLLINTWQLSKLQADTPIRWILFLVALRGLALGMTVQTTFVTALSAVPRDRLARGSSLVNSTRFVVQSIGVAVLATVLASALSPDVRSLQQQFRDVPRAATQRFGLCETSNKVALIGRACQENLIGFERAYRLTFYFAIVAVVLAALLPGWPGRWMGRGAGGPPPTAP